MNPDRWNQIREIFNEALERPAQERSAFLAEACAGEPELRQEIESLLKSGQTEFMERPAVYVAAESMSRAESQSLIGQRLNHYEIRSILGSGGMADVYGARDTKLNRDVAIKMLPDEFSRDPDRVSRFRREAEVLASLSHPNIGAIHSLEEANGSRFLVLELVEGETLAERTRSGRLPVDETLKIATGICEALEAAHEKGIVHRDLKPANVKITPEGNVKVLDFGLAKAMSGANASPAGRSHQGMENTPMPASLSNSPTLGMTATNPGMILGTAAYMSPEQAKGTTVDRRADIWAFGVVLYEMLTGRRLFSGETTSEILAAVMMKEPDWSALPAVTPGAIRRLLRRCLQKDSKLRLHDMADARIEIEEARSGSGIDDHGAVASRGREWIAWPLVTFLTLIAVVLVVRTFRPVPPAPPAPEMRLEITTQPTANPASLAISPDGLKIVFAATSEGRSRLWIRSLDSVPARALPGTENARYPFWAPDSRSVGFFAEGKLKRIDINGGSAQILANVANGGGGAWSREDVILFAPLRSGPIIFRVSAKGGEPVAVTRFDAQQGPHLFPQFLPDGEHFLYYVDGAPETRGIYIGQLDGSKTERVLDADSAAASAYASPGQLLFVRSGTLFAQDFDPDRRVLRGDPFPVAEQIAVDAFNEAAVSASRAGPIIFRTGSAGEQRQFVWLDRSGKEIEKLGSPDSALSNIPSLSPDGRRVALIRVVNGNGDVWLLDAGRGVLSRFTFDAAFENGPIWSPDGSRIVFSSNRKGVYDLYQKLVSGAASEELLLANAQMKFSNDWSPDGRFVLYQGGNNLKTGADLWVLPINGDRKPFPVVQTNFDELDGQFSPDGKWIAYQSNESGRFEIYVQPFPGPGAKFQVSTNGGAHVRWRRDGRELFYIALDDRLMAAPIRVGSVGQTLEAGAPVPLFATHIGGAVGQDLFTAQYMVSPDGQRFLMNTIIEGTASPITVLLNWKAKP